MSRFWGIELEPGEKYPIEFPEEEDARLRITRATLGLGESNGRSIVQCSIGDKSPVFLCSSVLEKNESCSLDLEFEEEEEPLTFAVIGNQSVHLSGLFKTYAEDKGENGRPISIENKINAKKDKGSYDKSSRVKDDAAKLKRKAEDIDHAHQKRARQKKSKKNKNNKKSQDTEEKTDVDQTAVEIRKTKGKSSKVTTFPSGLIVENVIKGPGYGKRAGLGDKVKARYYGRLKNGQRIGANIEGAPIIFTIGEGEVIEGWDVGVIGMRVGDLRRLTIPPSMGYKDRGVPPIIPPNAWLVFELRLIGVDE